MAASIKDVGVVAVLLAAATSCEYNAIPSYDCTLHYPEIGILDKSDELGCGSSDGSITVSSIGGLAPISYSINGGGKQESNIFTRLPAGLYTLAATDARGCIDTIHFKISNFESKLSAAVAFAQEDNECLTDNGSLTIHVSGGVRPYSFALGNQSPGNDSVFLHLGPGDYQVVVSDAMQCAFALPFTIERGITGVSWSNEIQAIVMVSCSKPGCHVPGTGRVDLTQFEKVKNSSSQIRARVLSRSMPFDGPLPDDQIQLIICWIDDGAQEN